MTGAGSVAGSVAATGAAGAIHKNNVSKRITSNPRLLKSQIRRDLPDFARHHVIETRTSPVVLLMDLALEVRPPLHIPHDRDMERAGSVVRVFIEGDIVNGPERAHAEG